MTEQSHQHNFFREWSVAKSCHFKFAQCLTKRKIWNHILLINTEKWLLPVLSQKLYSRTLIIQTSIIRISWLSGLFLWSQFGYKYLLVTIKIPSYIPFKTTALKSAVKCKAILLSKRKRSPRACCNQMKNIQMSSDWLRVALLLSEISRSMACLALYGKQRS